MLPAGPPANDADQRSAWTPRGVRHHRGEGARWCEGRRSKRCTRRRSIFRRRRDRPCMGSSTNCASSRSRLNGWKSASSRGIVASDVSRRLATVPGIGPITASAIAAAVPDGSLFGSGRQFAAWLGLTPRAHSSGGTERRVGITKQGDGYIRRLLVIGATAVMHLPSKDNPHRGWAAKLLERRSPKPAAVVLANKTARIAWAVMTRGEIYAAPAA